MGVKYIEIKILPEKEVMGVKEKEGVKAEDNTGAVGKSLAFFAKTRKNSNSNDQSLC